MLISMRPDSDEKEAMKLVFWSSEFPVIPGDSEVPYLNVKFETIEGK